MIAGNPSTWVGVWESDPSWFAQGAPIECVARGKRLYWFPRGHECRVPVTGWYVVRVTSYEEPGPKPLVEFIPSAKPPLDPHARAAQWMPCSPRLLKAGLDCATTERRDGGYFEASRDHSHDHLVPFETIEKLTCAALGPQGLSCDLKPHIDFHRSGEFTWL